MFMINKIFTKEISIKRKKKLYMTKTKQEPSGEKKQWRNQSNNFTYALVNNHMVYLIINYISLFPVHNQKSCVGVKLF